MNGSQGLSKVLSRASEQAQGGEGLGGEAPQGAGDVAKSAVVNDRSRGVAQRSQDLRRAATGDRAGVFTHRHVADAVNAVFDRPVRARKFQQRAGTGLFPREAGDDADCFDRGLALLKTLARDATDLFDAGKVNQARNARERFDTAFVDAPVPFVERPGRAPIRLAYLSLEGEARSLRTRFRSRCEVFSGCL